ncbi:MFS transporter [Roseomonas sp. USHLN139]|uniref:MFS transporter n=1 Tax=Roseomonas sp. USHLN139 TaxID=3081298 RepID=UPI003B02E632
MPQSRSPFPAADPAEASFSRSSAAAIAGLALVALQGSLAAMLLPLLAAPLALSSTELGWLFSAQLAGMVLGLLPMASLVPLAGPRGAFRLSLLMVLGTALLAALPLGYAPTLALRLLQGIATALLLPASLSLLRLSAAGGRLGLAVGAGGLAAALSLYLPSLAWLLLNALNLLPTGLAAAVLAPVALAGWALSSAAPAARQLPGGFDPLGMLLSVATLALLLVGIPGLLLLRNPLLGALLLGGLVLLGLWIWQQRGREAPLLPGDLLARPRFTGALLARLLATAALALAELVLINHVVRGWGIGPAVLAVPLGLAGLLAGAAALAAGWLLDRRPAAPLLPLAAVLLGAGYTLFAALPPGEAAGLLLLGLLALAAGRGLLEASITIRLLRSAPPGRSPAAAAAAALVDGLARLAAPLMLALALALPTLTGGEAVQALGLAALLALLAALAGCLGQAGDEDLQGSQEPDTRVFSDQED